MGEMVSPKPVGLRCRGNGTPPGSSEQRRRQVCSEKKGRASPGWGEDGGMEDDLSCFLCFSKARPYGNELDADFEEPCLTTSYYVFSFYPGCSCGVRKATLGQPALTFGLCREL